MKKKAASTAVISADAQAQGAQSPEQRKYQQLANKIATARETLRVWMDEVPPIARLHHQKVQPLQTEWASQSWQLLQEVEHLLTTTKLSQPDQQTLQRVLAEGARDLIDSDNISDDAADALEAMHDRYSPVSLAEDRLAETSSLKDLFQNITGVDLGDRVFKTTEELHQHAEETLRRAAEAGEGGPTFDFGATKAKKQTANQKKRAAAELAKKDAEAQATATSLREVFRKLASALHPDRAVDDADRERRTVLMQRVNQAYSSEDLLGLFALQLEIEQIDTEHLAKVSTERLRHYNRILATQRQELQAQIAMQVEHFGLHHGIEPWRRLNPKRLGPVLQEELLGLRGLIAQVQHDLRKLQTPVGVKQWIKQRRSFHTIEDDQDDDYGFGMSF